MDSTTQNPSTIPTNLVNKFDLLQQLKGKIPSCIKIEWLQVLVDSEGLDSVLTRLERAKEFSHQFGVRYHNATLEAFAGCQAALAKTQRYLESSPDKNLILYGPCGTGKDYLLFCCVMQSIIKDNLTVIWFNGADLFGQLRAAIPERTLESKIEQLKISDLLVISDPQPIKGDLSGFITAALYRIVEYRYRHCLPVWLTANFKTRDQFYLMFSEQIATRLNQNAVAIPVDGENYREKQR